jgi:hypothetical protein
MPMACSSKGEMLVRQQTRDDSPWMINREILVYKATRCFTKK